MKTEFGLPAGEEALLPSADQRRGDAIVSAVRVVTRARNERREVEFCIATCVFMVVAPQ